MPPRQQSVCVFALIALVCAQALVLQDIEDSAPRTVALPADDDTLRVAACRFTSLEVDVGADPRAAPVTIDMANTTITGSVRLLLGTAPLAAVRVRNVTLQRLYLRGGKCGADCRVDVADSHIGAVGPPVTAVTLMLHDLELGPASSLAVQGNVFRLPLSARLTGCQHPPPALAALTLHAVQAEGATIAITDNIAQPVGDVPAAIAKIQACEDHGPTNFAEVWSTTSLTATNTTFSGNRVNMTAEQGVGYAFAFAAPGHDQRLNVTWCDVEPCVGGLDVASADTAQAASSFASVRIRIVAHRATPGLAGTLRFSVNAVHVRDATLSPIYGSWLSVNVDLTRIGALRRSVSVAVPPAAAISGAIDVTCSSLQPAALQHVRAVDAAVGGRIRVRNCSFTVADAVTIVRVDMTAHRQWSSDRIDLHELQLPRGGRIVVADNTMILPFSFTVHVPRAPVVYYRHAAVRLRGTFGADVAVVISNNSITHLEYTLPDLRYATARIEQSTGVHVEDSVLLVGGSLEVSDNAVNASAETNAVHTVVAADLQRTRLVVRHGAVDQQQRRSISIAPAAGSILPDLDVSASVPCSSLTVDVRGSVVASARVALRDAWVGTVSWLGDADNATVSHFTMRDATGFSVSVIGATLPPGAVLHIGRSNLSTGRVTAPRVRLHRVQCTACSVAVVDCFLAPPASYKFKRGAPVVYSTVAINTASFRDATVTLAQLAGHVTSVPYVWWSPDMGTVQSRGVDITSAASFANTTLSLCSLGIAPDPAFASLDMLVVEAQFLDATVVASLDGATTASVFAPAADSTFTRQRLVLGANKGHAVAWSTGLLREGLVLRGADDAHVGGVVLVLDGAASPLTTIDVQLFAGRVGWLSVTAPPEARVAAFVVSGVHTAGISLTGGHATADNRVVIVANRITISSSFRRHRVSFDGVMFRRGARLVIRDNEARAPYSNVQNGAMGNDGVETFAVVAIASRFEGALCVVHNNSAIALENPPASGALWGRMPRRSRGVELAATANFTDGSLCVISDNAFNMTSLWTDAAYTILAALVDSNLTLRAGPASTGRTVITTPPSSSGGVINATLQQDCLDPSYAYQSRDTVVDARLGHHSAVHVALTAGCFADVRVQLPDRGETPVTVSVRDTRLWDLVVDATYNPRVPPILLNVLVDATIARHVLLLNGRLLQGSSVTVRHSDIAPCCVGGGAVEVASGVVFDGSVCVTIEACRMGKPTSKARQAAAAISFAPTLQGTSTLRITDVNVSAAGSYAAAAVLGTNAKALSASRTGALNVDASRLVVAAGGDFAWGIRIANEAAIGGAISVRDSVLPAGGMRFEGGFARLGLERLTIRGPDITLSTAVATSELRYAACVQTSSGATPTFNVPMSVSACGAGTYGCDANPTDAAACVTVPACSPAPPFTAPRDHAQFVVDDPLTGAAVNDSTAAACGALLRTATATLPIFASATPSVVPRPSTTPTVAPRDASTTPTGAASTVAAGSTVPPPSPPAATTKVPSSPPPRRATMPAASTSTQLGRTATASSSAGGPGVAQGAATAADTAAEHRQVPTAVAAVRAVAYGTALAATVFSPSGPTKPTTASRALQLGIAGCDSGVRDDDDGLLTGWPATFNYVAVVPVGGNGAEARALGAVLTTLAVMFVMAVLLPLVSLRREAKLQHHSSTIIVAAASIAAAFYGPNLVEASVFLLARGGTGGAVVGLLGLAGGVAVAVPTVLGVDAQRTMAFLCDVDARRGRGDAVRLPHRIAAGYLRAVALPVCDHTDRGARRICRAALAIDVAAAHAVAAVAGVHASGVYADNLPACRLAAWLAASAATIFAVYLVTLRPYAQRSEQVVVTVQAAMVALLCVLVAASLHSATNSSLLDAAVWLSLAVDASFIGGAAVLAVVALCARSKDVEHASTTAPDAASQHPTASVLVAPLLADTASTAHPDPPVAASPGPAPSPSGAAVANPLGA